MGCEGHTWVGVHVCANVCGIEVMPTGMRYIHNCNFRCSLLIKGIL